MQDPIVETAHIIASHRTHGEDRLAVLQDEQRTVIVVADGAGGMGNGAQAAETVLREIQAVYQQMETAEQWEQALKQLDFRIGAGESTAVVVDVRSEGIVGASVGDSGAWLIDDGEISDLTSHQLRKPLLGSQQACPVSFTHDPLHGLLLVATDGFFNYVKRHELTVQVSQVDFYTLPRVCVELVRLPSGDLWDDIALVACRIRPVHRTRQRYSI